MKELDPKQTKRAEAFKLWMKAPMPMVTLIKTLDISHLIKFSRRHHHKLNMLMCWCIGKAVSQLEEFYLLPAGDKMIRYDALAVSTGRCNPKRRDQHLRCSVFRKPGMLSSRLYPVDPSGI